MALLELKERRPMNDDTRRVFSAVENFIESNPTDTFDSYTISNEIGEDRKLVNRALKRLEQHSVIVPAVDDDGNIMHMQTGTRGRPPVQFVLAEDTTEE